MKSSGVAPSPISPSPYRVQVSRRRATGADAEATAALLAREERIANGIYEGIRAPRVTLGTVVAVFLSAHPLAIDQIPGGTHHG